MKHKRKGGRYTAPHRPMCPDCGAHMVPVELPDWMGDDDRAQAEALIADGWTPVVKDDGSVSFRAPLEWGGFDE